MAKKRGRPPKAAGEGRTAHYLLKLLPAEKRAYLDAAQRRGVQLADWIRSTLNRASKR